MYCTQCGTRIHEGASFCTECGHPTTASAAGGAGAAAPSAFRQLPTQVPLGKFYFSAEGRIGRKQYWLYLFLPTVLISAIAAVLDLNAGTYYTISPGNDVGIIGLIASLLILVPSIIVQIKRLHDRDKSGWWMLLILVPLIGAIWLLVELGFLKGTAGSNRFGPPFPENASLAF